MSEDFNNLNVHVNIDPIHNNNKDSLSNHSSPSKECVLDISQLQLERDHVKCHDTFVTLFFGTWSTRRPHLDGRAVSSMRINFADNTVEAFAGGVYLSQGTLLPYKITFDPVPDPDPALYPTFDHAILRAREQNMTEPEGPIVSIQYNDHHPTPSNLRSMVCLSIHLTKRVVQADYTDKTSSFGTCDRLEVQFIQAVTVKKYKSRRLSVFELDFEPIPKMFVPRSAREAPEDAITICWRKSVEIMRSIYHDDTKY